MGTLLTVEDICTRYRVSKATVYRWTSEDLIPHARIGGKLFFRIKDLEPWEEKFFHLATEVSLL